MNNLHIYKIFKNKIIAEQLQNQWTIINRSEMKISIE